MPKIDQTKPYNININIMENDNDNKKYKFKNKLIFNYSLKNDLKLKNKLTLDLSNNYNSIEANTNRVYKYQIKNPKFLFNLDSINKNENIFDNNDVIYENKIDRKPSFENIKIHKYNFNNKLLSIPFSLKKAIANKNIIVNHNLDSFLEKNHNNNISSHNFNYKEKYNDLKIRMNNLIENLFKFIENQKNIYNK